MRPAETQILVRDNRETLRTLPEKHFHVCATSPPYWNLRDYGRGGKWEGGNDPNCDHRIPGRGSDSPGVQSSGLEGGKGTVCHGANEGYFDTCGKCGAERVDRQIGREKTPAEYVANLVSVFREVRRVLRDDAILFVNLGSTYANGSQVGDDDEPFVLRDDLSPNERAYVLSELTKVSQKSEVSPPNHAVTVDPAVAPLASGKEVVGG